MDAGVTFIGLFVLLALLAVPVLLVIGLVAALVNRSTRKGALITLGVLAVLALPVVLLMIGLSVPAYQQQRLMAERERQIAEDRLREVGAEFLRAQQSLLHDEPEIELPTNSPEPDATTPNESASDEQPSGDAAEETSPETAPPPDDGETDAVPEDPATSDASATTSEPITTEQRPDWVESAPQFDSDSGVDQMAVCSGPYKTKGECVRALGKELRQAANQYVEWYLGQGTKSALAYLSMTEIEQFVSTDGKFSETIDSPTVGPMRQLHVLLEFDQDARARIDQRWHNAVLTGRLAATTLILGGVLTLLATFWAYLRCDTATGGRFSGRLQIGAVATILTLVVSGVLLARWIPWV